LQFRRWGDDMNVILVGRVQGVQEQLWNILKKGIGDIQCTQISRCSLVSQSAY